MSAKKIKAARRSATRIEAIRPVPVAPKGWPLLTIRVLATLGLSIGTYLTVLHYQAGTSGTIDSPFCGVGTLVNCSAVLGSAYARILSLPVALWAAAMYAAVLVVSLFAQTGLLILLCGWMFAFSVYMAGLSLLVTSRPTKLDMPLSATAATASTEALPPVAAAGSKPVVRTVMTLILSPLCTVAIALPA